MGNLLKNTGLQASEETLNVDRWLDLVIERYVFCTFSLSLMKMKNLPNIYIKSE